VREIEELVKNTNEDSCTNADDHAVCMDRCLDAIEGVYEAALSPVPVPVPIKINCYVKGHPGGSDCPICRSNFDDEEAGPALKGETQK
jgi:hypothetical protein